MNCKVKTKFNVIFRIVNTVLINAHGKHGKLNGKGTIATTYTPQILTLYYHANDHKHKERL
jgi:hypothetical protein